MARPFYTPCTQDRRLTRDLSTWKHYQTKHKMAPSTMRHQLVRIASDCTAVIEFFFDGSTEGKRKGSGPMHHYTIYVHMFYKDRWYLTKASWKSYVNYSLGSSFTIANNIHIIARQRVPKLIKARLGEIKKRRRSAQRRVRQLEKDKQFWDSFARFEEVLK